MGKQREVSLSFLSWAASIVSRIPFHYFVAARLQVMLIVHEIVQNLRFKTLSMNVCSIWRLLHVGSKLMWADLIRQLRLTIDYEIWEGASV